MHTTARKIYKRQHGYNFPSIIAALLNQDTQSHAFLQIDCLIFEGIGT